MSPKSHTELEPERRPGLSPPHQAAFLHFPLSLNPDTPGWDQSWSSHCMALEKNSCLKNELKNKCCISSSSTHSSARRNLNHSHPWPNQRGRQGRPAPSSPGPAITVGKTASWSGGHIHILIPRPLILSRFLRLMYAKPVNSKTLLYLYQTWASSQTTAWLKKSSTIHFIWSQKIG